VLTGKKSGKEAERYVEIKHDKRRGQQNMTCKDVVIKREACNTHPPLCCPAIKREEGRGRWKEISPQSLCD
jgi:hypothetical protein